MPAEIYRPRRPRESPLYQLLDRYYDQFQHVYDQRYQKRYGFWRPVIAKTVDIAAGRRCLNEKTPRLRRPQGGLRPRAVPQVPLRVLRGLLLPQALCPSCHQKRALLVAEHIVRDVCEPVPHRQFVWTIPKRLRIFFRFDRTPLHRAFPEALAEGR